MRAEGFCSSSRTRMPTAERVTSEPSTSNSTSRDSRLRVICQKRGRSPCSKQDQFPSFRRDGRGDTAFAAFGLAAKIVVKQKYRGSAGTQMAAILDDQASATVAGHDGQQQRDRADEDHRSDGTHEVGGQGFLLCAGKALGWKSDGFVRAEPLPENPDLGRIQGVLFVDDDSGGHVKPWVERTVKVLGLAQFT